MQSNLNVNKHHCSWYQQFYSASSSFRFECVPHKFTHSIFTKPIHGVQWMVVTSNQAPSRQTTIKWGKNMSMWKKGRPLNENCIFMEIYTNLPHSQYGWLVGRFGLSACDSIALKWKLKDLHGMVHTIYNIIQFGFVDPIWFHRVSICLNHFAFWQSVNCKMDYPNEWDVVNFYLSFFCQHYHSFQNNQKDEINRWCRYSISNRYFLKQIDFFFISF